jgi:hypothetical protein
LFCTFTAQGGPRNAAERAVRAPKVFHPGSTRHWPGRTRASKQNRLMALLAYGTLRE